MKISKVCLVVLTGAVILLATLTACAENPDIEASQEQVIVMSTSQTEEGLVVGDIAPDFALTTIDDKTVMLSDFHGKFLMINVWWSGCEGCVEEAPYIQAAFNKLSSKPEFAIITINTWDTPEMISKFIENKKLTFPVLIDPDKTLDPLYLKYGVPTTYFLDTEGIIREIKQDIFQSPEEIENMFSTVQQNNPPATHY